MKKYVQMGKEEHLGLASWQGPICTAHKALPHQAPLPCEQKPHSQCLVLAYSDPENPLDRKQGKGTEQASLRCVLLTRDLLRAEPRASQGPSSYVSTRRGP